MTSEISWKGKTLKIAMPKGFENEHIKRLSREISKQFVVPSLHYIVVRFLDKLR